jgi:hypothetical protein
MWGVGHKTSPCTATFNDLLCYDFIIIIIIIIIIAACRSVPR